MKSIVTMGRKSLARAALAIVITLGFASPAQAETITYTCEGEQSGGGPTVQVTWTVDIDFSASRLKIDNTRFFAAVITEREITFDSQDTFNTRQLEGRIDRLAGTMSYRNFERNSSVNAAFIQGRCRRATTKI